MKLARIGYEENQGTPAAWQVEPFALGDLSLVVGKNAAGKTRVLSLIRELSALLAQKNVPNHTHSTWNAFWSNDQSFEYRLRMEQNRVLEENLMVGAQPRLTRGSGGVGRIWAERLGAQLDFQSPDTALAVSARQDSIQHPFLAPLEAWAKSVHSFPFTSLGRPHALESMTQAFAAGTAHSEFLPELREELAYLGFDAEEIGLVEGSENEAESRRQPLELFVKEKRLQTITRQRSMSQGMLRSIALLIHLNRLQLGRSPACILIDDFAEGLDFERAGSLTEIVLQKCRDCNFQAVLTTNDRVVMNRIPLQHWSVLKQETNRIRIFNQANSPQVFENFKLTGLCNFDFFSMDFSEDSLNA